tara:strand:+ start:118 stop:408 length:291 start_codon:yes stop_codon:yes gene_type:complete
MTSLLETIKKYDTEMESTKKDVVLLTQALMSLVDDLIDRDLTLCVEPAYMKNAYQVLKERGLMDSHRSEDFETTWQGLCDTSAQLKRVHKTITGME